MKPSAYLSSLLLFVFQLSKAQVEWKPLDGPNGATINKIVATDTDELVMWAGGNRMFKSVDHGDSWFDLNEGLPSAPFLWMKHLEAGTNGRVYFVCDDEMGNDGPLLYRLDPATNVWEYLGEDEIGAFSTNPAGHIYFTRGNNLWRSTNEGASFSLINSNVNSYTAYLYTLGNNQNYNYQFSSEKMLRFNDNGTGLSEIAYPGSYHLNDIKRHPSGRVFMANHGVYWSENGINNWNQVGFGSLADSNKFIRDLAILPSGRLFATMDYKVIFSDDLGENWELLAAPFFSTNKLAVSSNALYYFTGSWCTKNTLLRSYDDGETWSNLSENIKAPIVSTIKSDQAGNLYMNRCQNLAVEWSTDGGSTWLPFKITGQNLGVNNIWISDTGHLFAMASPPGGLQRSSDGGFTWEALPLPNAGSDLQLYFSPNGEIFAGYFKSTDWGDTWVDETGLFPPDYDHMKAFAIHPNGDMFVSLEALWSYGNFRSKDGGVTWEEVLTEFFPVDFFHINSKGHVYFSEYSSEGLYVSYDNLETYELVLPDENGIGPVVSNIAGDVFAITENEVVMTNDDGQIWTTIVDGLAFPKIAFTLFIDHEQYLYLGNGGDVIYKTSEPTVEANFVTGRAWFDTNGDCLLDTAEMPLHQWLVRAEGTTSYLRTTSFDGQYFLPLPNGDYTLNVELPNSLWESVCSKDVPLSFQGMGMETVDFPIGATEYCPALQVDISTPFLRRCFENQYTVRYCNEGTQKSEGTVIEITLDTFMVFESASVPMISQNGQLLLFDIGEVDIFECGSFEIYINLSCDAALGEEHCVDAKIYPDDCSVVSNLPAVECQVNMGAFDPNDKRAFAEGRQEDVWVNPNTDLEFLIRFQNTGTDTAYNIQIEDRLSFFLDPTTVVPGASSHHYTWSLENSLLTFFFENIVLPDSNTNEAASHGFVKFGISQKVDVPLGNKIFNDAAIFFDFNEAVQTNSVALNVGEPVSATYEPTARHQALRIDAYPNPFSDVVNLHLSNTIGRHFQYSLFNPQGRLVERKEVVGHDFQVNNKGLPSGLYFLVVKDEDGSSAKVKLVIK